MGRDRRKPTSAVGSRPGRATKTEGPRKILESICDFWPQSLYVDVVSWACYCCKSCQAALDVKEMESMTGPCMQLEKHLACRPCVSHAFEVSSRALRSSKEFWNCPSGVDKVYTAPWGCSAVSGIPQQQHCTAMPKASEGTPSAAAVQHPVCKMFSRNSAACRGRKGSHSCAEVIL